MDFAIKEKILHTFVVLWKLDYRRIYVIFFRVPIWHPWFLICAFIAVGSFLQLKIWIQVKISVIKANKQIHTLYTLAHALAPSFTYESFYGKDMWNSEKFYKWYKCDGLRFRFCFCFLAAKYMSVLMCSFWFHRFFFLDSIRIYAQHTIEIHDTCTHTNGGLH